LLGDYSLNISAKKIKTNENTAQEIIANLMGQSFGLHDEKAPYVNAYWAMYKRLEFQKTQYEQVKRSIQKSSLAFQKAALSYALENQNLGPDALGAHLITVLLPKLIPPELLTLSQEYNALGVVAKKQIKYYLDQEKTTNLLWIKKIKDASEYKKSFFDFFEPSKSPIYSTIKQEFNDATTQSLKLLETVVSHNHLKDKAMELMERVLRTEIYNTYTCRLAFSEIKVHLQKSMDQIKSQIKPLSIDSKQQFIQNPSKNPAIPLPMPIVDTESAWTSWLSEVKLNPETISTAIKDLETKFKVRTNKWETDLLHYNILIKLVTHWIEAIKWHAISRDVDCEIASEQALAILRNCNKLLAKRYHPDKNQEVDDEAMKSFNACRDEGINQIESAIRSETPSLWITALLEKNPKLIITNFQRDIDTFHKDMDGWYKALQRDIDELHKDMDDRYKAQENWQKDLNTKLDKQQIEIDALSLKARKFFDSRNNFEKDNPNQRTYIRDVNAANNPTCKPKPRYPATALSPQHQQVLSDNHWEITQLSEDGANFFTALASEINKIKQKYEELTESTVRLECLNYYQRSKEKEDVVIELNQFLKKMDGDSFQTERLDHYDWIANDNETSQIIEGACCVEGVILCNVYKLPAIFEIFIEQNNEIQYACATRDGYRLCSETEFNRYCKDSPVLFRNEKMYYFASPIQTEIKKEDIIEELFPTEKDNFILSIKTKKTRQSKCNDPLEYNKFTL
jgi:hypothetical protein